MDDQKGQSQLKSKRGFCDPTLYRQEQNEKPTQPFFIKKKRLLKAMKHNRQENHSRSRTGS